MDFVDTSGQSDLLAKIIVTLSRSYITFGIHLAGYGIGSLKAPCSPELATSGMLLLIYFYSTCLLSENIKWQERWLKPRIPVSGPISGWTILLDEL